MIRWIQFASLVVMMTAISSVRAEDELRIGMIGLDTSHVVAFTKVLNDPSQLEHVPGGRVVAAFRGGSDDIESSYTRLDKFTAELRDTYDVEIVETIPELCKKVDAIMLMSVDGRPHLEQARPVFEAGLPMFIDKPIAGSLADAIKIFQLSEKHDVPVFSSSSYRYYPTMTELQKADVGEIRSAVSWGPAHYEEHHPDLFWYGVHPTEALFTIMGSGLKSVSRIHTSHTDIVTGIWEDGRLGTLRGLRDQKTPHKVVIFGTKATAEQPTGSSTYAPLVVEIIKFFETGKPPFDPRETLEMFAFMEAADESKRQGGATIDVDTLLKKHGFHD